MAAVGRDQRADERADGVKQLRGWLIGGCAALALPALAAPPVPVETAFRFSVRRAADGLALDWAAAPGHYLYRDRFEAATGDGRALALATPPGEAKDDPNFGPVEVYHGQVSIPLPAADLPPGGAVRITYQGCAESGFCYAPVTKRVDLRTLAVAAE